MCIRDRISTTDIFATVASIIGYKLGDEDATDSYDMLPAMLGIQDKNLSLIHIYRMIILKMLL